MKQRKNGHRSIVSAASLLSLTALAVATSVVSCAEEDLVNSIPMSNVLTFQVKVNDAVETKTRSGIDNTLDGFFPTSSLELRSDDNTIFYANCEERNGIHMHYDTSNTKTRGTVVNNNNFYPSFLLYGYTYNANGSFSESTTVSENIKGVTVNKSSSGTGWQPTDVTWPGASYKATFYAIAPADAVTPSADAGGPTFTYTVPQSASDQKDLLVSKCENVSCDGKSAPTLTFNHALAAIKFAKGNIAPYTSITKVEITGVQNSGTYDMNTGTWSGKSSTSTNSYSLTSFTDNDVLFLMPQTLPSGAQLKVTLSDGSTTKVLTSDLSGNWQNGNQYTYSISVDQITGTFKIEVTQTVSAPKAGGNATISVKSYFEYGNGSTKISVPWTATNAENNISISGEGNADGETMNVTIGENPSRTIDHANTLKSNQVSTEAPYDLSMFNGVQSTANCYVVQGCGWYKLPLVYGNGITKGVVANGTNGFCFDASTNYMNHAGNAISSLTNAPYIYNNGYNLDASGKIVWESITGLIQSGSVQLCDNNTYLKFYVDPDKVQQGNAVIAVTTGGIVAWSWHIWVTDAAWEATYTYGNYNFMCMPLGFVDGSTSTTSAAPRTVNLQFTQNISGGASKTIKISQEGDASRSGTCTFYQWGRKDPFKAESQSSTGTSQVAQFTAIQNPSTFYNCNKLDWSTPNDNMGYNYWCVGNISSGTSSANPVKKSIYDPSPVGYCVPPSVAYAALNMGQSWFEYNNNGFSNSANGDYWQLFGYINRMDGSMEGAGDSGSFWSVSPNYSNGAYDLVCRADGSVNPQNLYYRSHGFTVRPVSE